MILTTHQKFVLGTLKKLGCVRQRQLHVLVRRFRQADLEITRARMDAVLWQLRIGTADVRMDHELVWLSRYEPDDRRHLEAIDVMIELTKGKPQNFSAKLEPPCLLSFASGENNGLKLFMVASVDISPPELLEQARKERMIWISDGGVSPKGLVVQRFERDKQQMYGKILSKW